MEGAANRLTTLTWQNVQYPYLAFREVERSVCWGTEQRYLTGDNIERCFVVSVGLHLAWRHRATQRHDRKWLAEWKSVSIWGRVICITLYPGHCVLSG